MSAHWQAALAQLFFPQRTCLLCGAETGHPGLCQSCRARLAAIPLCEKCAAFLPKPGLCKHCAEMRPAFVQARAAAPYTGRLREALLSFKYQEKTWLRRPLAALLAQTCEAHYREVKFDAVLPVPLSAQRLKTRGYNHSEMLSELLAAEFSYRHESGWLTRLLDTPPLATYNGPQRRALLRRAFAVAPAAQLSGHTILLVDDIYTSGATLNACAATLKKAGAAAVYGLTVAAYDGRDAK